MRGQAAGHAECCQCNVASVTATPGAHHQTPSQAACHGFQCQAVAMGPCQSLLSRSAAQLESPPPALIRANNAVAKPAGVGYPHPKRFHTPCSSCLSAQRWLTTTSHTGTIPAPLSALFSATSCSLVPYLLVRLYSWPGRYPWRGRARACRCQARQSAVHCQPLTAPDDQPLSGVQASLEDAARSRSGRQPKVPPHCHPLYPCSTRGMRSRTAPGGTRTG